MRKCPLCGGELEARVISHPQEYKGKIIILENVPAEVCLQCGEVLIRPEVLERMQEVIWSKTVPRRTARIPVYDLAGVIQDWLLLTHLNLPSRNNYILLLIVIVFAASLKHTEL